jgi:hypothetical protein
MDNNQLIKKETNDINLDYHHLDLKYLVTKNFVDNSLIFVYYYLDNKEYINCYKTSDSDFSTCKQTTETDINKIICCTLKYNNKILYLTKYLSKFKFNPIDSKNPVTFRDILYNFDNFEEEMLTGTINIFQNNKFIELPINFEIN